MKIAFIGSKGGIGKTLLAQIVSMMAAACGNKVRVWDLDGQPGTTFFFCSFEENWAVRTGVPVPRRREALKRDPNRKSVIRVLMNPEAGLEGVAIEFPLAEVLDIFPYLDRLPSSNISVDGLLDKMCQIYQIPRKPTGKLVIIPNSGSFEALFDAMRDRKMTDQTYLTYTLLDNTLKKLNADSSHFDIDIFDDAGERGILPDMTIYTADKVILPFEATTSSKDALKETIEDVLRVKALRPASFPPLQIIPVLNKVNPSTHAEVMDWCQTAIIPMLETFQLTLCPVIVPESMNIGQRANRCSTPALLYDPLDAVNQSVFDLYNHLMEAVK